MTPMVRRNLHLPIEMWEQLQEYAAILSAREKKPVPVSEAVRRILDRSLARTLTEK